MDLERLARLRGRWPQSTAQVLRDCGARQLMLGSEDALLFHGEDAWPSAYLPPLDKHLVGVGLETTLPSDLTTTWLAGVGLSRRTLQRGEVMVVPAGSPAFVQLPPVQPMLWLAFRPQQLYGAARRAAPGHALSPLRASPGAPDAVLHSLALALFAAATDEGPTLTLLAEHVMRALALQLLTHFGENVTARHVGGIGRERLEQARAFLDSRLAEPVELAEAAEVAGCSVHHFAHQFKAAMGVAPMRYLRERRMQSARELIETTGLSIAEIGHQVGLPDAARFSQAFRAYWKTSPSALRRQG